VVRPVTACTKSQANLCIAHRGSQTPNHLCVLSTSHKVTKSQSLNSFSECPESNSASSVTQGKRQCLFPCVTVRVLSHRIICADYQPGSGSHKVQKCHSRLGNFYVQFRKHPLHIDSDTVRCKRLQDIAMFDAVLRGGVDGGPEGWGRVYMEGWDGGCCTHSCMHLVTEQRHSGCTLHETYRSHALRGLRRRHQTTRRMCGPRT
jgi:hypothetical protein